MRKFELVEKFLLAIKKQYKYIAVYVQIKNSNKCEIIINDKDNFESKLSYYTEAYDDDLKLKKCPDIRILNAKAINKFEELDK